MKELNNPPHSVTVARPWAVRSYLDDLLDNQVVRDEEVADLPRGIAYFHLRGPIMDFISENLRFLKSSFFIKHTYTLYIPEPTEAVCTPSTGCIALYKAHLELGLRFPLDPFIV